MGIDDDIPYFERVPTLALLDRAADHLDLREREHR
jgi:hypothetical protein